MILALDTATDTISIALWEEGGATGGRLRAELTWAAPRRHTHDLTAALENLLQRAGLSPEQVTALAVTTGPGSFSGVRAGISTVKGFFEGVRLTALQGTGLEADEAALPRVVGVPTLTVSAAPWLDAAWSLSPAPIVCAFLPAGRGRLNWCFFGPEDLLYRPPADAHGAGTAAEFADTLRAHPADTLWLAGDIDEMLVAALRPLQRVTLFDGAFTQRRAGVLARLAALLLAEGVDDSIESLHPLYLRPPA